MSGVEVAGLVLGAFPIVVSALEKYRQAFEPLKSWWKFERTFDNFIDDVGIQYTFFESNLEKLLGPFVDSQCHLGILLKDPWGPAWRTADLDEKLRQRLGSSYHFYKSIVCRMNESLSELQDLLGLKEGQAITLWAKKDPRRWELELELKRFRISFSRKKFNHANVLSIRNEELAKLLQVNDELAPLRKRRQTKPNAYLLRTVRDRALHLHTALNRAWHCRCRSAHPVNIRLERRVREKAITPEHWKLLLSLDEASDQATWQEVEVHGSEDDRVQDRAAGQPPQTSPGTDLKSSLQQFKQEVESSVTRSSIANAAKYSAISTATSVLTSFGGNVALNSTIQK